MMTSAETTVVEISRHHSVNGYVYEYDESLASVKEIQDTHQQRINWWAAKLNPRRATVGAGRIPRAA
ncbi:MAG: hypothetical protein JWO23_326 [Solirubrobacterales bacterium]|jgi:hypothetical protein|nr:hypothetical protein [Solirubrobacterales bacterium]